MSDLLTWVALQPGFFYFFNFFLFDVVIFQNLFYLYIVLINNQSKNLFTMKNLITSALVIIRLFVATFIIAFFVAAAITYFVTSIKFALFLASASLVPSVLFVGFYYDKYLADEI